MSQRRVGALGAVLLMLVVSMGSNPATPSYVGVEQAIKGIRAQIDARPQAHGPGWAALVDSIEGDLKTYTTAENEDQRLKALGKLYGYWNALGKVNWKPATTLRMELQSWLKPRVALAWASRRLVEGVRGLPATATPEAQVNRQRWVGFVGERLGSALREYESAESAAQRVDGLKKLQESLEDLKGGNKAHPWTYSMALQRALDDLYDLPNLDARIDLQTMNSLAGRSVVEAGPIWWKGQTTFVTPGRRTGFGLLTSDTAIVFYNSQLAKSITPIAGFNEQLEADPQGRQATMLYKFSATSRDDSQVTVTAVLSPYGLEILPSASHSVDVTVHAEPTRGNNLFRMLAGFIGMSQDRITAQVRDGALTRLRQQVPQSADELARIRAGQAKLEQNARLKGFLPGDGSVKLGPLQLAESSFRSRPDQAQVSGTVGYGGGTRFRGADMPRPSRMLQPESGAVADIHLTSALGNAAAGYLMSPDNADVRNVMIQGRKVDPDAPPQPRVQFTQNSEYAVFYKAVEAARAANDSAAMPIRLKRPPTPPEFTSDADGHLIAVVRDFEVEIGVPRPSGVGALIGGGANAARVYRFKAPVAELTISFEVMPPTGEQPLRLSGKIESLDIGTTAKVESVGTSEEESQPVGNLMRATAVSVLMGRVTGQAIELPLTAVQVPEGFAIKSVSALDPTGWVRLVLVRR